MSAFEGYGSRLGICHLRQGLIHGCQVARCHDVRIEPPGVFIYSITSFGMLRVEISLDIVYCHFGKPSAWSLELAASKVVKTEDLLLR